MDPATTEIERVFLANRGSLLSFLLRLGAGHAAEDILQDLWLRLPRCATTIREPRSYLFRMANSLLIDWERSRRQRSRRETAWVEVTGPLTPDRSEEPAADRRLQARQDAAQAFEALAEQGVRVARIFRRHRVDGLTQREIAVEMEVSIGTVEGDLRRAYRALIAFRERSDKE